MSSIPIYLKIKGGSQGSAPALLKQLSSSSIEFNDKSYDFQKIYASEEANFSELVEDPVARGSTTIIFMGPTGSGKTTTIRQVLRRKFQQLQLSSASAQINAFEVVENKYIVDLLDNSGGKKEVNSAANFESCLSKQKLDSSALFDKILARRSTQSTSFNKVSSRSCLVINVFCNGHKVTFMDLMGNEKYEHTPANSPTRSTNTASASPTSNAFANMNMSAITHLLTKKTVNGRSSNLVTNLIFKRDTPLKRLKIVLNLDPYGDFSLVKSSLSNIADLVKNFNLGSPMSSPTRSFSAKRIPSYAQPTAASVRSAPAQKRSLLKNVSLRANSILKRSLNTPARLRLAPSLCKNSIAAKTSVVRPRIVQTPTRPSRSLESQIEFKTPVNLIEYSPLEPSSDKASKNLELERLKQELTQLQEINASNNDLISQQKEFMSNTMGKMKADFSNFVNKQGSFKALIDKLKLSLNMLHEENINLKDLNSVQACEIDRINLFQISHSNSEHEYNTLCEGYDTSMANNFILEKTLAEKEDQLSEKEVLLLESTKEISEKNLELQEKTSLNFEKDTKILELLHLLDEKDAMIAIVSSDLNAKSVELVQTKANLEELTRSNECLASELRISQQQSSTELKTVNAEIQEQKINSSSQISELKAELSLSCAESMGKSKLLEQSRLVNSEMQSQLDFASQQLSQTLSSVETVETVKKEMGNQLAGLELELSSLKTELVEKSSLLDSTSLTLDQVTNDLIQRNESINDLNSKVHLLHNELNTANRNLEEEKASAIQASTFVHQLESTIVDLRDDLANSVSNLQHSNAKFQALESEVQMNYELAKADKDSLDQLNKELMQKTSQIDYWKHEAESAKSALDTSISSRECTQTRVAELTEELSKANSKLSALASTEINEANLKDTLQSKEEEIQYLNQEIDERDEELDNLSEKLDQRSEEIACLTVELKSVKFKMDNKMEELSDEISQQRSTVQSRESEIIAMVKNRAIIERKLVDLKDQSAHSIALWKTKYDNMIEDKDAEVSKLKQMLSEEIHSPLPSNFMPDVTSSPSPAMIISRTPFDGCGIFQDQQEYNSENDHSSSSLRVRSCDSSPRQHKSRKILTPSKFDNYKTISGSVTKDKKKLRRKHSTNIEKMQKALTFSPTGKVARA